jgi:hypothetical protein
VQTAFYEADPFSGSKGEHYATIESDQQGRSDEVWIE